MASVNKVILIGNCGRDPEIRYLPSGQAVANISIATTSRRKDRTSGERLKTPNGTASLFTTAWPRLLASTSKKAAPFMSKVV